MAAGLDTSLASAHKQSTPNKNYQQSGTPLGGSAGAGQASGAAAEGAPAKAGRAFAPVAAAPLPSVAAEPRAANASVTTISSGRFVPIVTTEAADPDELALTEADKKVDYPDALGKFKGQVLAGLNASKDFFDKNGLYAPAKDPTTDQAPAEPHWYGARHFRDTSGFQANLRALCVEGRKDELIAFLRQSGIHPGRIQVYLNRLIPSNALDADNLRTREMAINEVTKAAKETYGTLVDHIKEVNKIDPSSDAQSKLYALAENHDRLFHANLKQLGLSAEGLRRQSYAWSQNHELPDLGFFDKLVGHGHEKAYKLALMSVAAGTGSADHLAHVQDKELRYWKKAAFIANLAQTASMLAPAGARAVQQVRNKTAADRPEPRDLTIPDRPAPGPNVQQLPTGQMPSARPVNPPPPFALVPPSPQRPYQVVVPSPAARPPFQPAPAAAQPPATQPAPARQPARQRIPVEDRTVNTQPVPAPQVPGGSAGHVTPEPELAPGYTYLAANMSGRALAVTVQRSDGTTYLYPISAGTPSAPTFERLNPGDRPVAQPGLSFRPLPPDVRDNAPAAVPTQAAPPAATTPSTNGGLPPAPQSPPVAAAGPANGPSPAAPRSGQSGSGGQASQISPGLVQAPGGQHPPGQTPPPAFNPAYLHSGIGGFGPDAFRPGSHVALPQAQAPAPGGSAPASRAQAAAPAIEVHPGFRTPIITPPGEDLGARPNGAILQRADGAGPVPLPQQAPAPEGQPKRIESPGAPAPDKMTTPGVDKDKPPRIEEPDTHKHQPIKAPGASKPEKMVLAGSVTTTIVDAQGNTREVTDEELEKLRKEGLLTNFTRQQTVGYTKRGKGGETTHTTTTITCAAQTKKGRPVKNDTPRATTVSLGDGRQVTFKLNGGVRGLDEGAYWNFSMSDAMLVRADGTRAPIPATALTISLQNHELRIKLSDDEEVVFSFALASRVADYQKELRSDPNIVDLPTGVEPQIYVIPPGQTTENPNDPERARFRDAIFRAINRVHCDQTRPPVFGPSFLDDQVTQFSAITGPLQVSGELIEAPSTIEGEVPMAEHRTAMMVREKEVRIPLRTAGGQIYYMIFRTYRFSDDRFNKFIYFTTVAIESPDRQKTLGFLPLVALYNSETTLFSPLHAEAIDRGEGMTVVAPMQEGRIARFSLYRSSLNEFERTAANRVQPSAPPPVTAPAAPPPAAAPAAPSPVTAPAAPSPVTAPAAPSPVTAPATTISPEVLRREILAEAAPLAPSSILENGMRMNVREVAFPSSSNRGYRATQGPLFLNAERGSDGRFRSAARVGYEGPNGNDVVTSARVIPLRDGSTLFVGTGPLSWISIHAPRVDRRALRDYWASQGFTGGELTARVNASADEPRLMTHRDIAWNALGIPIAGGTTDAPPLSSGEIDAQLAASGVRHDPNRTLPGRYLRLVQKAGCTGQLNNPEELAKGLLAYLHKPPSPDMDLRDRRDHINLRDLLSAVDAEITDQSVIYPGLAHLRGQILAATAQDYYATPERRGVEARVRAALGPTAPELRNAALIGALQRVGETIDPLIPDAGNSAPVVDRKLVPALSATAPAPAPKSPLQEIIDAKSPPLPINPAAFNALFARVTAGTRVTSTPKALHEIFKTYTGAPPLTKKAFWVTIRNLDNGPDHTKIRQLDHDSEIGEWAHDAGIHYRLRYIPPKGDKKTFEVTEFENRKESYR